MQETQEMQVQSLGWEGPLEEEMATHSSVLAWKVPWIEEPGRLQPIGSQRVRQDWAYTAQHKSPQAKHFLSSCPSISRSQCSQDLIPRLPQAQTLVVLPEGQCSEGSWIGENLFTVSFLTSQQGWPSWQPEVMSVVWAAKCGGPLLSFLRKWGSVSISSVSFLLSAMTHPPPPSLLTASPIPFSNESESHSVWLI